MIPASLSLAPSLELGLRHVAALPQLLMRGGRQVADPRREAHDEPALGIRRDQERPAGAASGERLQIGREPGQLLGALDVPRRAGGHVALEEDQAADLHVADQRPQLLVARDFRPGEAHEEEVGDGKRLSGLARPRRVAHRGAASQQQRDERCGAAGAHQRQAPRAATSGIGEKGMAKW